MPDPVQTYDYCAHVVHQLHQQARQLEQLAANLEDRILRDLGITYRDRGPGFCGWSFEGAPTYYPSPRDALIAKVDHDRKLSASQAATPPATTPQTIIPQESTP